MSWLRAFLSGLLCSVNRFLFALILVHFIQGAFIAYRAYVKNDLSPIGVIVLCVVVAFVCASRIYKIHKQGRELKDVICRVSSDC